MVTVQGSKVRSPAIGRIRPLNGTGIFPMFEAGISAALTKKGISLIVSFSSDTERYVEKQSQLQIS